MLTTITAESAESADAAFRNAVSRGHALSLEASRSKHVAYADFLAKQGKLVEAWITLWAATCFCEPEVARADRLDRQLGRLIKRVANADRLGSAAIHPARSPAETTADQSIASWLKAAEEALSRGDLIGAAAFLWRVEQRQPSGAKRLSACFLKARVLDDSGLSVAALRSYLSVLEDGHFASLATPYVERLILAAPNKVIRAMVEKHGVIHAGAGAQKALKTFRIPGAGAARRKSDGPDGAPEWRHDGRSRWAALARLLSALGKRGREIASSEGTAALLAIAERFDKLGAKKAATRALVMALSGSPRTAATAALISRAKRLAKTAGARPRIAPPLILVSQIQRSGGTLLSQLFDGHPELLTHPHEIQIGRPKKWHWPDLDLSLAPEDWLTEILEPRLAKFILRGYSKPDGNTAAVERLPFNLDLERLCARFLEITADLAQPTQRAVIDAYLTAFFDAWQDYPRSGCEKWSCGFVPRLISNYGSVRRYLSDYPEGLLISCIRNPVDWFVSARRHDPEYADLGHAIELWKTSTLSALHLQDKEPRHVYLLTYERLVAAPEAEMRRLAERLGISFEASLLTPTYLGIPMLPNSSFRIDKPGIYARSVDRRQYLSDEEQAFIERDAMPLHGAALEAIAASREAG